MRDIAEERDSNLATYREQFKHLDRAADVVFETLRAAILDGYLGPGTWLREEPIAREFGLSRTPVREALQQLRKEGLVTDSPYQGAIVTQVSAKDVVAVYAVREPLEGLAARMAAMRATPGQQRAIQARLQEMYEARELSPDMLVELDKRFHLEIARAADNVYLVRFLAQLKDSVRRFGRSTHSYPAYPERIAKSLEEHSEIVDAILAGDADRAERAAIDHMRAARELRLRILADGY